MGNEKRIVVNQYVFLTYFKSYSVHLLDCRRWNKSLFSFEMADSFFCKGQDKRLHFILITPLTLYGGEIHLIGSPQE